MPSLLSKIMSREIQVVRPDEGHIDLGAWDIGRAIKVRELHSHAVPWHWQLRRLLSPTGGNIAPDEWHRGIPLRPSGCATKRRYAAATWLELERLRTRTVALPDPENVKTVTYQVLSEALIAVMSVCICIPFSSILSRFACSDSKRRRVRHFSE